MTLPLTRNTTYAALSQVKSADLNAIQDCIVSGKHGTKTEVIPLIGITQTAVAPTNTISLTNPNFVVIPFRIPVGSRITAIRVGCIDSATGPTKLQCALYDISLGGASPGTLSTASAGTGAQQTIQVTGLTSDVAAGHVYGVYVARSTGTATCTINNVEIDYHRP